MKEALADTFAGIGSFFGISQPLIHLVAPDMTEYWNPDSEFGSKVRFRMTPPLRDAMDRDDDILVIAHSLGCMIAYDTFWKFARTGEYRPTYTDKEINLFVTLGCPLGDETVKKNLKGAQAHGLRRFPTNITSWLNIAAEDDFVSHDQEIVNDYKEMVPELTPSIKDERIYNLAVRHGKSNPHHGAGYLIHPTVADAVADWL